MKYSVNGEVYLPIIVNGLKGKKISISRKNKGSIYFYSPVDVIINGFKCNQGMIKIEFKKFDRSSSWDENIASKYVIENYAIDCTKELISLFDKITK